jgi:hypothetical protein
LFSSKFGGLALLLQSTGFFLLFAFLFLLLHAEEFRVVVGIGPERFGWLQGLSQDSKLCQVLRLNLNRLVKLTDKGCNYLLFLFETFNISRR